MVNALREDTTHVIISCEETKSDQTLRLNLTKICNDLDLEIQMNVVTNCVSFPKSPDPPKSDLRFRSYGQNTEQGYKLLFYVK